MATLPADATIDGEAVVRNEAGIADFERPHSREHDAEAVLYAFDLLELDIGDLRPLRARLRELLKDCPLAI